MKTADLKEVLAGVNEEMEDLPEGHTARPAFQKVRAMIDATLHGTPANEDPNPHNCDQIYSHLEIAQDLARGPSVRKEPKKSGKKKSGGKKKKPAK